MKKLLVLSLLLKLLTLSLIVTTPLWYDENYTLAVLRLPLGKMFTALSGDVHPPLWYLLMRPFAFIGPAWAIRLPSLLFSCITLVLFYFLLERRGASHGNLLAFTLYALTSTGLFYASEGRMYAWLGMLVMAGALVMFKRKPVWLGVISAALLWSHNYGIFYTAALWLAAVLYDRSHWRTYTLTISGAVVSFLPWGIVLFRQMGTISGGYWIAPLTVPNIFYALYESVFVASSLRLEIWTAFVFWGWAFLTAAWYLVQILRHKLMYGREVKSIISLAFLPVGLAVLGSVLWHPILLYRALTPSVPFLLLLLCAPIVFQDNNKSERRNFLLALTLIAPVFMLQAVRLLQPGNLYRGKDSGELLVMLETVEADWNTGDLLVHQGDGSWIDTVNYFSHRGDTYKLTECGSVAGSLSPLTRAGLGMQTVTAADLHGRVWFITERTPMSPTCDRSAAYAITGDVQPLACLEDNLLESSCLYLLELP